jgi:hypothetical protein
MVESKSAPILNDFNGFSDETADSAPRYINRLETRSEYITPSRPTFADGGHLKWRVRSEAKRHDNPGAQISHSMPHLHDWLLPIPEPREQIVVLKGMAVDWERRWSKLKRSPIGGSVWITLTGRILLLAYLQRSDRMNFPEREGRGLAPYWIICVTVSEVQIVVERRYSSWPTSSK